VFQRCFGKKIERFFLKLLFFIFLDRFDMLILKINFKKYKKNYFNIFSNKKYFKKQLLSQ
jgi:hypothetical protein